LTQKHFAMRYFMHLAYNGTPYHGWQIQPNADSVQQTLEYALGKLCGEELDIVGCGRTDTGVHAKDFYAHFDTRQQFDEAQLKQLTFKLNAFLPEEILIFGIFPVPDDLHARFSATARTYQYHVSEQKQPFGKEFTHRVYVPLDTDLMNTAAEMLLGEHDFTSFSKLHTQTATNICNVTYAHWERTGDELVFTIKANRFLRNMVRAIAGTLIDVGRGKTTLDDLQRIIDSKDRCSAGTSLPAKALFLTEVEYDGAAF
jgi:tRNA pseudouridine38-40 synthase